MRRSGVRYRKDVVRSRLIDRAGVARLMRILKQAFDAEETVRVARQ